MRDLKISRRNASWTCAALAVCLFATAPAYSHAQEKPPQETLQVERARSLDEQVIKPLAAQLAEMSRVGHEHARRVDSGDIQVIRDPAMADAEHLKGWVLLVVHPMNPAYYTSTYTAYDAPKWKWAEGGQVRALVLFDEVLFTKTADSVDGLKRTAWQKTLSQIHTLDVRFSDGEWRWEDTTNAPAASPGIKVPSGVPLQ